MIWRNELQHIGLSGRTEQKELVHLSEWEFPSLHGTAILGQESKIVKSEWEEYTLGHMIGESLLVGGNWKRLNQGEIV